MLQVVIWYRREGYALIIAYPLQIEMENFIIVHWTIFSLLVLLLLFCACVRLWFAWAFFLCNKYIMTNETIIYAFILSSRNEHFVPLGSFGLRWNCIVKFVCFFISLHKQLLFSEVCKYLFHKSLFTYVKFHIEANGSLKYSVQRHIYIQTAKSRMFLVWNFVDV